MLTKPPYTYGMKKALKVGFLIQKTTPISRIKKKDSDFDENPTIYDSARYFLVHNSGSDRRVLFGSQDDFDRFEGYLYILNAIDGPRASNVFASPHKENVFSTARGEKLVAIGAYSLMPKGFFILLRPLVHDGVGRFMQKLQTAYTMYFNKKYQRIGRLFHSAYRSEETESRNQLSSIIAFVHLSPASLFDENWQEANLSELQTLAKQAIAYRYSSVAEYASKKFVITSPSEFPKFLLKMHTPDANMRSWGKYQLKEKILRLMGGE